MLSMSSIFSVFNNYQSFIITYFSFIYTHTVKTITMKISFTILNWKVYKRLWYYTVILHQFGYCFIDFGWCNLGNQIKDLYTYAGPILAVHYIWLLNANTYPFLKIFSNLVHFCQNFQFLSTFLCPFPEKSHPCPCFLA